MSEITSTKENSMVTETKHICSVVRNFVANEENGDLCQIFMNSSAPLQIMNLDNDRFVNFTTLSLANVESVTSAILSGKFYIELHRKNMCICICLNDSHSYGMEVLNKIKNITGK